MPPPAPAPGEGQAEPGSDEQTAVGDIIVTAQRREQRLQDVPVSVAAFTGDTLTQRGATYISDIFQQTPGVRSASPAGNAGFPVFNIRGVSLLDFSYTNEGSVAVYSNDVYQGNPAFATQQLFDIDRVEILRGPQGTLYGRNATGGLVSYIARRPTATFEGRALAQFSSFNTVVLEGAVSGPVSDGIRLRLAGRFNRDDGWQTNVVTGTKLASVDHAVGIRATLEADLSENILLTLAGNYSDTAGSEDGRAFFGGRVPGALATRCAISQILASQCANGNGFIDPNPDPRRPYSGLRKIPYAVEAAGGQAKVEWDMGFATLTSITAYLWGKKTDSVDVDASANSVSNLQVEYYVDHSQISQELRLGGDVGRLNWLVGGFYYGDTRFSTSRFTATRLGNYADQEISSISAFGQGTFALTETLNLTAGARYTKDVKDLNELALVTGAEVGTRAGTPLFVYDDRLDASKTTWRLGADWHVTPDVMLFTSASTGFKSGGYNTSLVTAVGAIGPVVPETITTYEAGVKADLLGRTLTANVTAFYSDYRDIQAAATVVCTLAVCITPSSIQYLNIGRANIYGGEVELVARPSPDLNVSLGVALNTNKLRAGPTVIVSGTPLDGKKLANTPEVGVNGAFNWEPSLGHGIGSLIFAGDFSFQDEVFFRADNTRLSRQPAYALVGAQLGWKSPSGLRIEAFARNLLDEQYFVARTDVGEVAPGTWGKPREIGVRLTSTF